VRALSIAGLALCVAACTGARATPPASEPGAAPRYLALGDSFTIGTGATPEQSYPARLTARASCSVELRNVGVNGYTTEDVIEDELPELARFKPTLVTLAIGANDIVQGRTPGEYRDHVRRILAAVKAAGAKRIVSLPQPDWSLSPAARSFGDSPAIHARIVDANAGPRRHDRERWPAPFGGGLRRLGRGARTTGCVALRLRGSVLTCSRRDAIPSARDARFPACPCKTCWPDRSYGRTERLPKMRALPFLVATVLTSLALCAGCSETEYTPAPTSDGYGPAGGGEHSSGSSSGSSGGVSSPPSQPSGGSSSGSGSGSRSGGGTGSGSSSGGGTGSTGFDAGTYEAGGEYDAGPSGDGGDVSALLPLCVSQINEFRNQNGQEPLSESTNLEAYAASAAASDAHNGQLHSYFYATSGGGGVAATEDELDGAKVAPGGSAQQTMEQGLQTDEQANGGAAANLLDNQFSEVGCGFGQDSTGNWWVVIGLH
jgi:hypothetical protein